MKIDWDKVWMQMGWDRGIPKIQELVEAQLEKPKPIQLEKPKPIKCPRCGDKKANVERIAFVPAPLNSICLESYKYIWIFRCSECTYFWGSVEAQIREDNNNVKCSYFDICMPLGHTTQCCYVDGGCTRKESIKKFITRMANEVD